MRAAIAYKWLKFGLYCWMQERPLTLASTLTPCYTPLPLHPLITLAAPSFAGARSLPFLCLLLYASGSSNPRKSASLTIFVPSCDQTLAGSR